MVRSLYLPDPVWKIIDAEADRLHTSSTKLIVKLTTRLITTDPIDPLLSAAVITVLPKWIFEPKISTEDVFNRILQTDLGGSATRDQILSMLVMLARAGLIVEWEGPMWSRKKGAR